MSEISVETVLARAHAARGARIARAEEGVFDIAVIGGGIHGVTTAAEAARAGCSVLLLEARDYGFGTSSRSSKLLHGGIRYLEQGNIRLVREALLERASMLRRAPHLSRALELLFPIIPGKTRPAWQVRIGLLLYDLLSKSIAPDARASASFKPHRKCPADSPAAKELARLGLRFDALYSYFDGQMDDSRVVIEHVLEGEELGACLLNHVRLQRADRQSGTTWRLRWRDEARGEEHESSCRYLVNTAGPWAPTVHTTVLSAPQNEWQRRWPTPVYSRGVHLLFDAEWREEGLILPTNEPGRYYWVLPYYSAAEGGVLVGTTDRSVTANEDDPQAEQEEIDELLSFVRRDLPHAGLDERVLYHSFCGVRMLGARQRKESVSEISRSEYLLEQEGYVVLLGGKYTTARETGRKLALRGMHGIGKRPAPRAADSAGDGALPGGRGWSEAREAELQSALSRALCAAVGGEVNHDAHLEVQAAVRRFGSRTSELIALLPAMSASGTEANAAAEDGAASGRRGASGAALEALFGAELLFAIATEHALTTEDVASRRLGLDDHRSGGEEFYRAVAARFQQVPRRLAELSRPARR